MTEWKRGDRVVCWRRLFEFSDTFEFRGEARVIEVTEDDSLKVRFGLGDSIWIAREAMANGGKGNWKVKKIT